MAEHIKVKVGTPAWTATVTNLGAQNPSDVTFEKSADFPTSWETVAKDGVNFVKIPKIYRKINNVVSNQITSWTISNHKLDDQYLIYPCFLDEEGNELDYVLLAKSISYFNTTLPDARTQAQALGTGYQLMDWMIKRLWEDLIILLYESVNASESTDKLGLQWNGKQWIDGVYVNKLTTYISYKPSKYVTYVTSATENYETLGYELYSSQSYYTDVISKLGYDENNPFVNLPSNVTYNNIHSTYYCSFWGSSTGTANGAIEVSFNPSYTWATKYRTGVGIFAALTGTTLALTSSNYGSRLCYRPIGAKHQTTSTEHLRVKVSSNTAEVLSAENKILITSDNKVFNVKSAGSKSRLYAKVSL